jgi:hypothetical protein
MNRQTPHVERSLATRLAAALGAAALSAVVLGSVVTAMTPSRDEAAFAVAEQVTIAPARIEVVGVRAPARQVG